MDADGYDSDGDLVLSLVPGMAAEAPSAAAEAKADRNGAAACQPSMAFAAATHEQQQNFNPAQQQQQQQPRQRPTATAPPPASRPLSAYNRSSYAALAPVAAPAPAPRAPSTSASPAASSFALPSSAKVALEELRVSLDPKLVTHATGHAMLPALAVAGVRARVGGGGGGGGGSGGEKQAHSLLRWRTVLFFRRRRRGAAVTRRRRAAPTAAAAEEDGDDEDDEEGGGGFDEEQVPFVLACLTAADFVRMVDRARSDGDTSSPSAFDPGAGLEGLVREASAAHPGCTLGVLIEGLESFCISRERADAARGDARLSPARRGNGVSSSASSSRRQQNECFVARRYDSRLLAASAAVRFPALRLALLPDAAAAAEHLVGLARALAEQPLRGASASGAAAAVASVPSSSSASSQQQQRHNRQLLRTHGGGRRGDTQAAREALLLAEVGEGGGGAQQQLPAASVALARALARVPGVGPAAAIAVAVEHGSLVALMRFVEEHERAAAASSIAELRTRTRNGGGGNAGPRVGPAAARRVVAMLRAVDGGGSADW